MIIIIFNLISTTIITTTAKVAYLRTTWRNFQTKLKK